MNKCAFACLPLLILAACGEDPVETPADDDRTATGEVLEGTISDAMLPLETLQSQPPLVEESPASSGSAASGVDTTEDPVGAPEQEPDADDTGSSPAAPPASSE